MVDASIIFALAFLHIVSAISWFGALVFFLSVLGPSVRTFTPGASLEFLAKTGPRQLRYFAAVASATIIFGLALLFAAFGTNYAAWPTSIDVGFVLGFIAYLIAMLVTIPTFRKLDRIAHGMLNNPQSGPLPPEFAALLKRGNMSTVLIAIILVITLGYMVGTAFPW